MFSFDRIENNLLELKDQIKSLTDRAITIVAVTKTFHHEIYDICYKLGITHLGENKAQELKNKFESVEIDLKRKMQYHFVGHLQTNKIKSVINIITSLDTLQSIKQIEKLKKICSEKKVLNFSVLLQLNSTNETTKSGIPMQDIKQIVDISHRCLEDNLLKLEGLMTIGPTPNSESKIDQKNYIINSKKVFNRMWKLQEFLSRETGCKLSRLSMGMSNDYKIALEEGSNEIRIGSLLFNARREY